MSEKTINEICLAMKALGMFFFKEYHPFGQAPAFRDADGTKIYFLMSIWDESTFGHPEPKLKLVLMTSRQLLAHLKGEWQPAGRAELDWKILRMERDLLALPDCPPINLEQVRNGQLAS